MKHCARIDLLPLPAKVRRLKTIVKRLPRFCTFDHSFAKLREEDDKNWYLKTKPVRFAQKTALEKHLAFTSILQRSDPDGNVRKVKVKPSDWDWLAEQVEKSQPLAAEVIQRNGLEKKSKTRGDLENLRQAVHAAKSLEGAGGPKSMKNVY